MVEQDSINVQIHRRREDWRGQVYLAGEKVSFESIGLTLPIEEIYSGVDLEELKPKTEAPSADRQYTIKT